MKVFLFLIYTTLNPVTGEYEITRTARFLAYSMVVCEMAAEKLRSPTRQASCEQDNIRVRT